jgi:hypothetical protein
MLVTTLLQPRGATHGSVDLLVEHISAHWVIEVPFADGKEELGLDQYQPMSAKALVRFWTKSEHSCEPSGTALLRLARYAGNSNICIDDSSCFGFSSFSKLARLLSPPLSSARLDRSGLEKCKVRDNYHCALILHFKENIKDDFLDIIPVDGI